MKYLQAEDWSGQGWPKYVYQAVIPAAVANRNGPIRIVEWDTQLDAAFTAWIATQIATRTAGPDETSC